MRFWLFAFFLLLFGSLTLSAAEDAAQFPNPRYFPMPEGYKPNVEFWMRVYGEWEKDKMIIHDAERMNIVFEVIEVPEENNLLRIAARASVSRKVDQIRSILLQLHNNPQAHTLSDEHRKIYELYKNVSAHDKFQTAASNLRVQQGIKERFQGGLERMPLYLNRIKRVFREQGLPEEIAYLPLVESSFNNLALSKTAAAGIWQFMPGTARIYKMRVNNELDERLDPIVAARAAATYLKKSYSLFGSWPLALMSYNHGQQGIANAVRGTGSNDFMTIFRNYRGKYFGFASRNFYAEFLAACKVMNEAHNYFHSINYAKPVVYDSIKLSRSLWISTLINHSSFTRDELRTFNPALQSSVIFSKRPIPAGYDLRLPPGRYKNLIAFIGDLRRHDSGKSKVVVASASSPNRGRSSSAKMVSSTKKYYVVRRGDTLFSISRKFDTSIDTLRKLNSLSNHNIHPGQRLFVAGR